MSLAADVGRHSGRVTPSLHDGPLILSKFLRGPTAPPLAAFSRASSTLFGVSTFETFWGFRLEEGFGLECFGDIETRNYFLHSYFPKNKMGAKQR